MTATATTLGVILTPSGASDDTTFVQGYLDTERVIAFDGVFPVEALWSKYSGQILSGIGSGHHTNTTELTSARSAFQYVGSQWVSGATDDYTILRVEPVSSALGYAQTGVRIDNIGFYGEGKAARGVSWRSNRGGKVNAFIQATRDAGFYIGVVSTLVDFRDPQWNTFEMIEVDQTNAAGYGPGVQLDGDATANASANYFGQIFVRNRENTGVLIGNADHNTFSYIRVLHGVLPVGYGIVFAGHDTDPVQVGRQNTILACSLGLTGIHSEGTDTRTYRAYENHVLVYDTQDGANPDPVVGTGSSLFWHPDNMPVSRTLGTAFPT